MNTNQRRKNIICELEKCGSVKTADLSELLGVSSMTIRRDFDYLAKEGIVTVIHGGAKLNEGALTEYTMLYKEEKMVEEKRRIGEFCLRFIREGEAVLIDTGTTARRVAEYLNEFAVEWMGESTAERKNTVVVSNSLPVQQTLAHASGIRLISAPGVFREKSMGFLGQMTCEFVQNLKIDTLFLGAEGVDAGHGVTVPNVTDAETKRAFVKQAEKVVVVADETKIGSSYFMTVASLEEIDVLVTNQNADPQEIERIREAGVEVYLV